MARLNTDATETKGKNKAAFSWEDPLLLEAQLSAEERFVRDTARSYCKEKLLPGVGGANRHERSIQPCHAP